MMSIPEMLLSPYNLLFIVILAGFAVGRIRIRRISLGIAGILLVAILVGFWMNHRIPETLAGMLSEAQSTMKTFSKLGTSLFVSVIGLQTGFSVRKNSKGCLTAFVIGALMSISGVMLTLLIATFDQEIRYPTLLGVLCGALTNTPGLSGVCELIGAGSGEAAWGYSCSYLFGVSFVVLFVQLYPRKREENQPEKAQNTVVVSKIYPELILLCMTALSGNILASACLWVLPVSVGSTACTLPVGLMVGYIARGKSVSIQPSTQVLNTFRNTGLALFFAGTGFSAGIASVSFEVKTVIYGALITLSAVLCGLLLCKIVPSARRLPIGFVVAGGMTSSPAYGAIRTQEDASCVNHFSFAYFGALISLVIATQILATLH